MLNQYKNVPVSAFFSVVIIIIFLLYFTTIFKTIPCGNTVLEQFYSNFIHTDIYHISANLYALYALSRVERKMGTKKFLYLIIFLLAFNTLLEILAKKLKPELQCSIGFSGVLYGVMTWELVTEKDLDIYILSSIIIMTVLPSLKSKNISLLSHGIGAFSGVISALVYRNIF